MAVNRVWVNPRMPQVLYIAQILLYIQGGLDLLFTLTARSFYFELFGSQLLGLVFYLVLVPGKVLAAFGIANRKRWGYGLGVLAAVTPLGLRVVVAMARTDIGLLWRRPIDLLFDIVLVALLLHTQSRQEVRHWSR